MITKIYGASDDLIEIEGAITDEVNVFLTNDNEKISFSASDGTKGKISYDDEGQWRIDVIDAGSKCRAKVVSVGDDGSHIDDASGCTPYSDVLIFEDGIEWIKIGRKTFKS